MTSDTARVRVPHTEAGDWAAIRAGSIADVLRDDMFESRPADTPIVLIGLPDDTGVALNNGRPGASGGPTAFRAALARFGSPFDATHNRPLSTRFVDCGDVVCSDHADPETRLHQTHDRASGAVQALHEAGFVTVGIGDGHDGTFAFARGLARHLQTTSPEATVGGVNLDPHLDVREETGSGMPFRQLVEQGCMDPTRFVELGIGRFSNSEEHLEYLVSREAQLVPIDRLLGDPHGEIDRAFASAFTGGEPGFVTIDLDALDGSFAPGVSAVNPMGVSPVIASTVAERAGADPAVKHFDIMELSPTHDDGRTARIAAMLFVHFLAGFGRRSAP